LYRGEERATGRPVAVKLLHRRNPETEGRLDRSYRLHREIDHPNIVRVRELIRCDVRSGLVMDWVEGEQFGRFWLGLPLSRRHGGTTRWASLRPVLSGILDALEHLHGLGIVHRDLTPRNIIVRRNWSPVVVDLEIAVEERTSVRVTSADRIIGTPLFVPPEVLKGGEPSRRGDLYSVGVMLFQCITGQPPFKATSFAEMVLAVQRGRCAGIRTFCPDLPVPVGTVVDRLLKSDPAERPDSVADLRMLLELDRCPVPRPSLPTLETEPPLVGRGQEVSFFRRHVREWFERNFHVVKLVGPRGIGKSRLLRAWAATASAMGIRSELTACLPGAPRAVLAPFLPSDDRPGQALGASELLRAHFGPELGPTVLIVDELDVADPQSLNLLQSLFKAASDGDTAPLVVVLAARTREALSLVAPGANHTTFELKGLPGRALEDLFCREDRDSPWIERIQREVELASAGNPEQVRDLLWERQVAGELRRDGAVWASDIQFVRGGGDEPEGGHRCPVEAVVGWLEELGQPLEIPLLLASAPADALSVILAIGRGMEAGTFFLKMAGDIPYLGMPGPHPFVVPGHKEAQELHARAARWLTLHLPGAGLAEERIAVHWRRGGRPDRAAASYRRAAAVNATAGLDSEALRLLRLSDRLERIARREAAAVAEDPSSTTSDLYELRALLGKVAGSTDRFRWSGAFTPA
jgi:hypothetical protein